MTYSAGFNLVAVAAMVLGVGAALIGFFVPSLEFLYKLSWFTGFGVAFLVYVIGMRKH